MKLQDEDRPRVKRAQDNLALVKKALSDLERDMAQMEKSNREAGRIDAAGRAMQLQGAAAQARGLILAAHGAAQIAICECFDDGADIIALGGGAR